MKRHLQNPSAFTKNIISVFTANSIVQFFPLLTAPVLTRIYDPSDYGLLGIILSITGILSVLVTGGYANAIITAETEEEALGVLALCLKIMLWVTLGSLILVVLLASFIGNAFHIENAKAFIYIIPLFVFLGGLSTIFGSMANRYKLFKELSVNRIIGVIINATVAISIGLYFESVIGLFISYLCGQLVNSLLLLWRMQQKVKLPSLQNLLRSATATVGKKFINFPTYTLPADFINFLSNQIPILVIGSFATQPQAAIGHYNMSNRMLGLPSSLISNAIGEVFKQRAAEDYHTRGTCRPIFLKTFKALLLSAILPFLVLVIWGGDLFAFAFGEKWRVAGFYSQLLSLMFFFRFIVSPLTYVFYIANKQKIDFWLHLLFILVGFGSLFVGLHLFESITVSLVVFSISYSVIYFIYFIFSFKFCVKNET